MHARERTVYATNITLLCLALPAFKEFMISFNPKYQLEQDSRNLEQESDLVQNGVICHKGSSPKR